MPPIVALDQNGHQFTSRDTVDLTAYRREQARMTDLFDAAYAMSRCIRNTHCYFCDEYIDLTLDEDAQVVRADTACPYPDGVTATFTLAVPSGRIVIADNLRPTYQLTREQQNRLRDYNSTLGVHDYSLAMAELGCAHGYVGNTCPTLFRTGADEYVISNADDDDQAGEPLAGIVTDVWAYCIADHDDYVAKGGTFDQYGPTIVEVPAGVYEFTNHSGERTFNIDTSGTVVFASIKRVA